MLINENMSDSFVRGTVEKIIINERGRHGFASALLSLILNAACGVLGLLDVSSSCVGTAVAKSCFPEVHQNLLDLYFGLGYTSWNEFSRRHWIVHATIKLVPDRNVKKETKHPSFGLGHHGKSIANSTTIHKHKGS